MIDLQPTNEKLRMRTNRILRELAGISETDAAELLKSCSGRLKPALVAALSGVDPQQASRLLEAHQGQVRQAVESVTGRRS
jgi:N-acetylmuramic acid 6-phosphate etherase